MELKKPREIRIVKDSVQSCSLAILYEFEVSDSVVLCAVGPATDTMFRIAKLFDNLGVKIISTERVAKRTSENFRKKFQDSDSVPAEFVEMRITLKRNSVSDVKV